MGAAMIDDARSMAHAFDLARRQMELDHVATSRFPSLEDRKKARLSLSPHGFLRGSAPLFFELLAQEPSLAAGPAGEGWLVGDMHLENVGAYRTEEERALFALNDFDDACVGPWRLDVLRLATSVLLAGRTFHATGGEAVKLCAAMLDSYVNGAWGLGKPPAVPAPVEALVKEAAARTAKRLLDDRAPVVGGKRCFVRGPRYLDLPPEIASEVPTILKSYVTALDKRAPKGAGDWEIVDAAHRVAGTGSLGVLRIAMLVRAKDGEERIFDVKEARPSACGSFVASHGGGDTPAFDHEAARVVAGARALNQEPPRLLASVAAAGYSFVARKLFPQEDKLDLEAFRTGTKLDAVVCYIGYLLGAAHARAVVARPPTPWSSADIGGVLDRAIEAAGVFESVYLAYSRISDGA